MGQCCTLEQTPRPQRRINGFQLPLNLQQVIAWIVFIVTLVANFGVLIRIQSQEVEIIALVIFLILYVSHIAAHIAALLIDPSEKELRKLKVQNVPEFDRRLHAHVIENGRCHLCNIYSSSKSTKHCSICNKCVDQFDHHCKWLNNCVGQRNYAAFITCITTAQIIAMLTTLLCIVDVILFLLYPQKLSQSAQNFFKCNSSNDNSDKFCRTSLCFLTFLVVFCGCALAIGCALLHLCCFHIYISTLGVTTYEYIVRESRAKSARHQNSSCCTFVRCEKTFVRKKEMKAKAKADLEISDDRVDTSNATELRATTSQTNESGVLSLINILISNEFNRSKLIFYDNNKIHPQTDDVTG